MFRKWWTMYGYIQRCKFDCLLFPLQLRFEPESTCFVKTIPIAQMQTVPLGDRTALYQLCRLVFLLKDKSRRIAIILLQIRSLSFDGNFNFKFTIN